MERYIYKLILLECMILIIREFLLKEKLVILLGILLLRLKRLLSRRLKEDSAHLRKKREKKMIKILCLKENM